MKRRCGLSPFFALAPFLAFSTPSGLASEEASASVVVSTFFLSFSSASFSFSFVFSPGADVSLVSVTAFLLDGRSDFLALFFSPSASLDFAFPDSLPLPFLAFFGLSFLALFFNFLPLPLLAPLTFPLPLAFTSGILSFTTISTSNGIHFSLPVKDGVPLLRDLPILVAFLFLAATTFDKSKGLISAEPVSSHGDFLGNGASTNLGFTSASDSASFASTDSLC